MLEIVLLICAVIGCCYIAVEFDDVVLSNRYRCLLFVLGWPVTVPVAIVGLLVIGVVMVLYSISALWCKTSIHKWLSKE